MRLKLKHLLISFVIISLSISCAVYKIEKKQDQFSGNQSLQMQGNLVSSSFDGDYRFNLIYQEPKKSEDFYLAEIYYKGMGWQFLNGLSIKIDGEINSLPLASNDDLVTSSGSVKEWARFEIEKDMISKIIESESVSIQVQGENFNKTISLEEKTKNRFQDFLQKSSRE